MTKDIRERFEKLWRESMNTVEFPLDRCDFPMTDHDDQPYITHETNRAWLIYQAATEDMQAELKVLEYPYQKTDEHIDHIKKISDMQGEIDRLKKALQDEADISDMWKKTAEDWELAAKRSLDDQKSILELLKQAKSEFRELTEKAGALGND